MPLVAKWHRQTDTQILISGREKKQNCLYARFSQITSLYNFISIILKILTYKILSYFDLKFWVSYIYSLPYLEYLVSFSHILSYWESICSIRNVFSTLLFKKLIAIYMDYYVFPHLGSLNWPTLLQFHVL